MSVPQSLPRKKQTLKQRNLPHQAKELSQKRSKRPQSHYDIDSTLRNIHKG
jgi:hypothetical protein